MKIISTCESSKSSKSGRTNRTRVSAISSCTRITSGIREICRMDPRRSIQTSNTRLSGRPLSSCSSDWTSIACWPCNVCMNNEISKKNHFCNILNRSNAIFNELGPILTAWWTGRAARAQTASLRRFCATKLNEIEDHDRGRWNSDLTIASRPRSAWETVQGLIPL